MLSTEKLVELVTTNRLLSNNFMVMPRLSKTALPFLLSLSIALGWVGWSAPDSLAIRVADVPNPRELNGGWVMDLAELLSDEAEQQLNQLIAELEANNGSEIAVVTVVDTKPSETPKAFATELFNSWGIGKAGVDNGVLFLVSQNERRTEIETGYGLKALLTDAQVGQILRNQVTPQFKQGNFEAGILNGITAISDRLQLDEISESLEAESLEAEPLEAESMGTGPSALTPVQPVFSVADPHFFSWWFTPSNFGWSIALILGLGLRQRLRWPNLLGATHPTGRTELTSQDWLYSIWLMILDSLGNQQTSESDADPSLMQQLAERKLTKLLGWLALGLVFVLNIAFAIAGPGWHGENAALGLGLALLRGGARLYRSDQATGLW